MGGRVYGISDVHGMRAEFHAMLQKIGFSAQDTLYILGDMIDKGPFPVELTEELMEAENIFCQLGNHENLAKGGLTELIGLLKLPQEARHGIKTPALNLWLACGGENTVRGLYAQKDPLRAARRLLAFIETLPAFREITVDEHAFILVHAGLGNYNEQKALSDYNPRDLIWTTGEFDKEYYPQKSVTVLAGHTPTFQLPFGRAGCVYEGLYNMLCLDAGACYRNQGGRLACLCLNDMEITYI